MFIIIQEGGRVQENIFNGVESGGILVCGVCGMFFLYRRLMTEYDKNRQVLLMIF